MSVDAIYYCYFHKFNFDRYGSPVNTREEYVHFAEWYLTTFTGGILEVLLRVLDQYRNKVYVSPRVLQQTISYIDQWWAIHIYVFSIGLRAGLIPWWRELQEQQKFKNDRTFLTGLSPFLCHVRLACSYNSGIDISYLYFTNCRNYTSSKYIWTGLKVCEYSNIKSCR